MYVIYGIPGCKYCTEAISLIRSLGLSFEYRDIETHQEWRDFTLAEGHRTVPQIYWWSDDCDGLKHIGGFTELKIHLSDTDQKKDVPENGI